MQFNVTTVEGIKFSYPVAFFFTDGVTALQLRSIVEDGLHRLKLYGITVIATVCDGAAENRAFIRQMADERARLHFGCQAHTQVGAVAWYVLM